MPRFYFYLRADQRLISDDEGVDLPSRARAQAWALETAREIVIETIRSGTDLRVEAVVVTDEAGCTK
jgi:hypothetical protein